MFNVCPQCGAYTVEKTIDTSGPFAICPQCGYRQPFLQLPLFLVTGASGAGKSTVCLELVARLRGECVVLESDILWGMTAADQDYGNIWLRVAKNIGQAGRPVVLCGTFLPDQLEACPERRYFSTLHYLALVCDNMLLAARLRQRPQWRNTHTDEVIKHMTSFNRWLQENAARTQPPMQLLDNSQQSLQETVQEVAHWIQEYL